MSGNPASSNDRPRPGNVSANDNNQGTSNVKKIFVGRDYTEGTIVKFQAKFPPELDGIIDRQHFDYFISTLNEMYYHAETSSTAYVESCFACLSAYLLYLCIETHYAKCMKKVAAFIDEQNETIWHQRGVHITDPIERGLRVIEIAIRTRNEEPSKSSREERESDNKLEKTKKN